MMMTTMITTKKRTKTVTLRDATAAYGQVVEGSALADAITSSDLVQVP